MEVGLSLHVHWERVGARNYFKGRSGREVRLKAGNRLIVAFQSAYQHAIDPLGEQTLETAAQIELSGFTIEYRVSLCD